MSGDDDRGGKKLPLFEFGKGRPAARGGIKPIPRRSAPAPDAPVSGPRTPGRGVPPLEPPPGAAGDLRPPPPPPVQPPPASRAPAPLPPAATPSAGTPIAKLDLNPPGTRAPPPLAPAESFAPRTPAHGVPPISFAPRTPGQGVTPVPPNSFAPRSPAQGVAPVRPAGHSAYPFEGRAKPGPTTYENPLSPTVVSWVQSFLRAIRGRRLYPAGNPVLDGYLEQAFVGLSQLLAKVSPMALRVREDRLFFEEDAVLVDPDRMEGLPFLLFSHSIQQIEFSRGMSAEELDQLIQQLSKDFGGDEHVGEDLVTALWRCNLTHFDYLVIDIYNLDIVDRSTLDPSAMLMDDETRRLRDELETIVGALRDPDRAPDDSEDKVGRIDPLVAQIDLPDETPEANVWDTHAMLRGAGLEGIDRDLQYELKLRDDHESLLSRLTDLLLSALRAEEGGVEGTPGWFLLLALLDAILRGRQFEEALRFSDRLANFLLSQPRPEDQALAHRILQHLGSAESVQVVLQVLDTTANPAETKSGLVLLEHLGENAYGALATYVGTMRQPRARRLVVELISRLVEHDRGELFVAMRSAPPEALRDLLGLGEALPASVASGLVWLGAEHEDEGVRARAVALLRGFGGSDADRLVARFMEDKQTTVRVAAFRAASHRKSQVVLDALLQVLKSGAVDKLQITEINVLLSALVAVGGKKVTPILGRLLTDSGTLGMSRHGADVRVGAAHALGSLGTPDAKAALQAGMRTLNRKVKQACRVALESKSPGALHLDLPARFGALSPRPPELDRPVGSAATLAFGPPKTGLTGLAMPPSASPPRVEDAGGLRALPPSAPPSLPASPAPPLDGPAPVAPPDEGVVFEAPVEAEAAPEAPPPLLDPAALRFASDVTAPEVPSPAEDPSATAPDLAVDDAVSVLEAPTLAEGAPPPAAQAWGVAPTPGGLADDLELDAPPVPLPRLSTSALVEIAPEEPEEGEDS